MPLDHDDINALYRDCSPGLLRYLMRRTFDAQVAVDLMAETFAIACEDRSKFRGEPAASRAWIYTIATNLLRGFYRSGKIERRAVERLGIVVPQVSADDFDRIEELAGTQELRAAVGAALDRLTNEQRDALRLRVVEERPYPEVASMLAVSEQVARARVSRALRRMRELVSQDHPEEVIEHA
jgi:RNA polymerase sigma-70 factor (ECF subfamily)